MNHLNEKEEVFNFDYFNYKKVNSHQYLHSYNENLFIRIPNLFTQSNISQKFNVHRVLLPIYAYIYCNRTMVNTSYITINNIMDLCKYKIPKNRTKKIIFYEIVKCILFLKESRFVDTDFDYQSITYNTPIEIKIIENNFSPLSNYTKLYIKDFFSIMNSDTKISKENLLTVYLYVLSQIGGNYPAFFQSIYKITKSTGLSNKTVTASLDFLSDGLENENPFLIKKKLNLQHSANEALTTYPNIYLVNEDGYQEKFKQVCNMVILTDKKFKIDSS